MPKTVVGETVEFVGAGPESMLLKHVQQAAAAAAPEATAKEPPAVSS